VFRTALELRIIDLSTIVNYKISLSILHRIFSKPHVFHLFYLHNLDLNSQKSRNNTVTVHSHPSSPRWNVWLRLCLWTRFPFHRKGCIWIQSRAPRLAHPCSRFYSKTLHNYVF